MASSLEHVEKFQRWMKSAEMNVNSKLHFRVEEDTGRGVWASHDIAEDELLFKIPFRCVLSAFTTDCPSIKTITGYEGCEWNALCISILYEYSKGEASFWFDYLHHFLPLSPSSPPTPYAPLFWKSPKQDLLKGTESYEKWQEQTEQIESLWTNASQFLCENAQLFGSLNESIKKLSTKEFFSYIYFLVQSYSFTLDSLSLPEDCGDLESLTGMCPMADALNHRTGHNNARLFTHSEDPEENPTKKASELVYEMSSIQPIPKGSEVFNTYGELPNSSLLVSYGFMDAENENDYLTFSTIEILCNCSKALFPGNSYIDPMKKALELLLEEECCSDGTKNISGAKRNFAPNEQQGLPKGFEDWINRIANHIYYFWGLSEAIQIEEFVFEGPAHVFGFVEEEPSPDLALVLFIQYITSPLEIAQRVDAIIVNLAEKNGAACCENDSACKDTDCSKPCCPPSKIQEDKGSCCEDSACQDICSAPIPNPDDCADEEEGEEESEEECTVISEILEIFESWTGREEMFHKTIELIVQDRIEKYATISESEEIPDVVSQQIIEKEKKLLNIFLSVHKNL